MIPTIQTITFIRRYRDFEKAPFSKAKRIIDSLGTDHGDHLFDSWRGRKSNFGDWFLNLSHSTQAQLIRVFGLAIDDTSIDNYLQLVETDPIKALWAEPPVIVFWVHELLKFFYNHGIEESPAENVKLVRLPGKEKCYGNSTNWGNYILSLEMIEQEYVLSQITSYIQKQAERFV